MGLLLGACGACGAPTVPASTDLVATLALADLETGERLVHRRLACPDLARIGVVLEPDRRATAPLPSLRAPAPEAQAGVETLPSRAVALRLEACATEEPVELEIVSRPLHGLSRTVRRTLGAGAVLRETLALGTSRDAEGGWGPGRLEIRAIGGTVYLQELVAHSATPPPMRVLEPRSDGVAEQILVISVDTLRADWIGPDTTPHLDALRREAEGFAPHYAAATWTQPSHATLLTGWPPAVHGVEQPNDAIHPGVVTLAERFRAGGLATEALVHDCVWLDPRFGFDRGFDRYDVTPFYLPKQARRVGDRLLELANRPFFFFFHTFDPHSDFDHLPYEAAGETPADAARRLGEPAYGAAGGDWSSPRLAAIAAGSQAPLPGEPAELERLYRLGVEAADAELGALFERLRQAGLWDNLMVVVTSDHGEALAGAGRLLHERPWNEVLRVPLLVKWPASRGGSRASPSASSAAPGSRERAESATSSLDLAPTLLAAAGLPTDELPGRPVGRASPRPVFAGVAEPVVIDDGFKAWFGPNGPRLYDLVADPGETRDLAAEAPQRLELLERRRAQWSARVGEWIAARDRRAASAGLSGDAPRELAPEEIERLQALGYLQ